MQDYIPRGIDINGTIDTVEVRQYDNNSRFIRVKLRDDDLAEDNNTFDLSDCTTALYIRPESGGDVSYISGTVESPSGVVTFLIPGSVTQVVGNYLCQIRIYEGDETDRPVISSKPFRLTVDESIAEDAAIEATPDYSALTATMTNYQAVKNQMAVLVASPAGSGGDVGTEVRDARVGKGQTYSTAGDAVRAAVQGVSAFLGATNFAASPVLADFNNLPNNIIRGCGVYVIPQSSSEADDIPAGKIKIANAPVTGQMTGLIVTLGRRTDRIAGDTQIFIPWHGGTIKYRQYSSVSVEQSQTYAWSDWVTGSEDLPQYRPNINNTAASYNNLLSNYTKEGAFFALAANWNDIPARDNNTDSSHFANNDSYVVTNKQYSNYILQTAVGIASGAIYNRVIHKTNNTVFRDWYCVNLDAKPMNILAVGDSICWGGRNNHKGFVGDLGLPYQNIGVVGATLSNKVTSVTNIPNKLVEFYNSHSQAVNANNDGWAPDVIIANGGVNDYFYSAPLGNVPTAPAITDAEANAFDRSTVMGGLQYLLYKMISCYPSAQRFFLISHKTYGAKSSADSTPVYWVSTACAAGYTQQDLHDAIVACCNVYGVRVIDVYSESMIDSVFSQYRSVTPYSSDHSITDTEYVDSDGIHPLAKGYLEGYKPLIQAALKGNTSGSYCSYQTLQNVRADLEDQVSKAVNGGNRFLNIDRLMAIFSGDFDNIPNNRIYPVNIDFLGADAVSAGITAASAHAPLQKTGGTLLTFGRTVSENHQNGDVQIFTTPDGADWTGEILVREYWDGWNAWHSLTDSSKRVWKGLKISVLGDSISSYSGHSAGNAYYSSSKIPSVNSMWWRQVCKITGAEKLVVDAYASSCCAVASASWTSGITPAVDDSRCRALHTGSTSSNNRVDPDIILIALGLNDFQANVPLGTWDGHEALSSSDTATWRGAYANMLLKIHTEYPDALVFCLSPWFFVRGNAAGVNVNTVGNTYQDYEDAMMEVCNILGGVYIDCSNFGFNRQNYSGSTFAIVETTTDGSYFHPNATGQEILGQSIAAAVRDKAVGYVNWLKAQRGV